MAEGQRICLSVVNDLLFFKKFPDLCLAKLNNKLSVCKRKTLQNKAKDMLTSPPPVDPGTQTFAGRWAGKLQDKVDGYQGQIKSGLPESDQLENELPEVDQRSGAGDKHGVWHQKSGSASFQPGHIVTKDGASSPRLQEVLQQRTSEIPLKLRTVGKLRHFRMKMMVKVVHRIIKLLTKTDELLIKYFHGNPNENVPTKGAKGSRRVRKPSFLKRLLATKAVPQPSQPVSTQSLEAVTSRPGTVDRLIRKDKASTQQVRQSALGPVIAENTEDLVGVVYPDGLPEDELKLYTNPRLVVIKDGETNEYGHALLAFRDPMSGDDRYVQISSANWYPEHLDGPQFKEYQSKWGNVIAYEIHLGCKNEEAMREKINELSKERWLWGGPLHNCMTFCKVVGDAGEASPELYESLTTISNRVATNVHQGLQSGTFIAISRFQDSYRPQKGVEHSAEDREMLSKLDELKRLMSEKVLFTPEAETLEEMFIEQQTRIEYMEKVFEQIPACMEEAGIPEEMHEELLTSIKAECQREVVVSVERGDKDFHEFDVRNMADLPLASAFNAPLNHRVVGPQSLAEALTDPEDFETDILPQRRIIPVPLMVQGGHLNQCFKELKEHGERYDSELALLQTRLSSTLLTSDLGMVAAKRVLKPEEVDEETNKPIPFEERLTWEWPDVTEATREESLQELVHTTNKVIEESSLPEAIQGQVKVAVGALCKKAAAGELPEPDGPDRGSAVPQMRERYPFTRAELLNSIFASYKSENKDYADKLDALHQDISALIAWLKVQIQLGSRTVDVPADAQSTFFAGTLMEVRELITESSLPRHLSEELASTVVDQLKMNAGVIDFEPALQELEKRRSRQREVEEQGLPDFTPMLSPERSLEQRQMRSNLDALVRQRSQETDSGEESLLDLPEWQHDPSFSKPATTRSAVHVDPDEDVMQGALFKKCYARALEEFPQHTVQLKSVQSRMGKEFMELETAFLTGKTENVKTQASANLIKQLDRILMTSELPTDVVETFPKLLVDHFMAAAPVELKALAGKRFTLGRKLKLATPKGLSDSFDRRREPYLTSEDVLRRNPNQPDPDELPTGIFGASENVARKQRPSSAEGMIDDSDDDSL